MSRSISREGFNELKNYLGVYLQQGRVILDSDWNESQDIAVSFMRRLNREAVGDGSPNTGFTISPVIPPPPELLLSKLDTSGMDKKQAFGAIIGALIGDILNSALYLIFGPTLFFLSFPGDELEGFESLQGFVLNSSLGRLRIGRDRPYAGKGFLRLSGHGGTVTITKTLPQLKDLSAHDLVTFRYRVNEQVPGSIKMFLEDSSGNRSVWILGIPAFASDMWLSSFAGPLDLRFRILTATIPSAVAADSYNASVMTIAGTAPMTWSVTGAPSGLTIAPDGSGEASRAGRISWSNPVQGNHTFTVKARDAGNVEVSRILTLEVKPAGTQQGIEFPDATSILSMLRRYEIPTGTPADLTRIRKYGFEVYQDPATPIVWDFDDMRLGSAALEQSMGENNFIIRGSAFSTYQNNITLLSILTSAFDDDDGDDDDDDGGDDPLLNLVDLLNADFELDQPSIENAGRLYVAGLPCIQIKDELYTQQADPNDPVLAPPGPGVERKDEVYLDVWTEAITYVQDPEIREIALGGPDTSTRLRVRHRVRVAQGGPVPKGNGIGQGTLATEGTYTARANRLYRVQIDTAGNVGVATFRWSEDNASTLARVIEPIPPGSTKVVVEDAAAFRQGDWVLIRKEFGEEEHRIATVFGNIITLETPTGTQLAQLPAASRVPLFTTFSLADRPMLQRWNAFKVPVQVDPEDSTISRAIDLNDGVKVRFGGKAMIKGDHWSFQTRYLAGDEASGIDPETRIEQLAFQRARGVLHYYVPLATITRNGSDEEPERIYIIDDRRKFAGNGGTINFTLPNLTGLTGTAQTHVGGFGLPASGTDSKYVVFWQGDLFITGSTPAQSNIKVQVSFYNEQMTDPATEPDEGEVMSMDISVPVVRKPKSVEVPLQLTFNMTSQPCLCLPLMAVPTAVHVFAQLSHTGFTVELVNQRVTVLELKKSY